MRKIKPFIRQLLPRIVIALVVISAVGFFVIWEPYDRARSVVLSEIARREENHKQRQTLSKLLVSLRSPDTIPTQKPGAFKTYANETQRAADGIKEIELVPPPKLPAVRYTPIPALKSLVGNVNDIITDPDFGERYKKSRVALNSADELLSYHAAVMKALVSVLEYNPNLDFKTFDLLSNDTRERLKLAENGLDKAKNRLYDAGTTYNDPYLDQDIDLIERLQAERNLLEKSGNITRWIQKFKTEKAKILNSRATFWKTESRRLTEVLNKVENELLVILDRWKQIQKNFEL